MNNLNNLTKNEKRALDDLFNSLKNDRDIFRGLKRVVVYIFGFIFKYKKIKNSSI